jgi:IS5 family transposase
LIYFDLFIRITTGTSVDATIIFGFDKVRYRGLKKNHTRLCACFALVNLYQHRQRLAPQGA